MVGVVAGLEWLVLAAFGKTNASALSFTASGASITISTSAGIGRTFAAPIGSAAVTAFVHNLERQPAGGVLDAWRLTLSRLWRLVIVQLLPTLLVILLLLTIIGIPYGLKKFVDWQFGQQEVVFHDRSIRDALGASTRMVHGHWWHTAAVSATFWVLGQIPGPLLGFALLFTTVPVRSVDLFGSVISALLVPYVAIGRTLLYFDLGARHAAHLAPATPGLAPAPAAG